MESASNASLSASVDQYETGRTFINTMSVLALLVGAVISLMMTRMIAGPIVKLEKAAGRMAGGDLSGEAVRIANRDEIGRLADSFNGMAGNIRELIGRISANAAQVADSAERLSASSEQLGSASGHIATSMETVAAGSNDQARSIEESTRSMDEMARSVRHIAAGAETVTSRALEAATIVEEGNDTIRTTVRQMDAIHNAVSGLAETIAKLGERSQQIGRIVDVISGIASQTNLLALNASIEAARVGEHGSGFSVVAKEVRKLAEQSGDSAQQIAKLIAAIQEEMQAAVRFMGTGTEEVKTGMQAVRQAGSAFERIGRSVHVVAEQLQEVSAASEQMSASTEQVVHSIHAISDAAKLASASTQEVSAAVEQQFASMQQISSSSYVLSGMSSELKMLVAKFQV